MDALDGYSADLCDKDMIRIIHCHKWYNALMKSLAKAS